MKNAAFIGSNSVYTPELQAKMKAEMNFPIPEVLTKDNLEKYAEETKTLTYLFSTWGMLKMTEEEIKQYFPNVRALFYGAGSVQGFARPFMNCGIEVFSAWAANAVPVAEFTVAEIVLANKGFFTQQHKQGSADWANRRFKGAPLYKGNYDVKVGIIGAGMIGKLVIGKLKQLDNFEILVFDPFLPDEKAEELGVKKVDLPTLFAECAVISNHLANNEQTKGMINADCFNRMSPSAVFINTGRGAQVVEDDMIAALKAEPMRVALLDVTFPEPPKPESELYTLPNVVLTPHIAGSMYNEVHRMAEFMYEEYQAFDAGKPTRYCVTFQMLETMA